MPYEFYVSFYFLSCFLLAGKLYAYLPWRLQHTSLNYQTLVLICSFAPCSFPHTMQGQPRRLNHTYPNLVYVLLAVSQISHMHIYMHIYTYTHVYILTP